MTTLALIGLSPADSDGWGMDGGGWWMPMMFGMVLFWGAIVLGVIWLIRHGVDRRREPHEETAVKILDRRFAEGAVTLDEYHQRRDVLVGAAAPRPPESLSSRDSERKQP